MKVEAMDFVYEALPGRVVFGEGSLHKVPDDFRVFEIAPLRDLRHQ